ncbi:MAG: RHS repeat-associated core domain-containing protein [Bacteroidota bacterium]
MAIYKDTHDSLMLEELHIYGSQRLGVIKENRLLAKYVNIFPPSSPLKINTPNLPYLPSIPKSIGGSITPITPIPLPYNFVHYYFGKKHYELTDWLGNVRVVINDKKTPQGTNPSNMTYAAQVLEVNDYYPFGSPLYGRRWSVGYRYGFNGKENDNEVYGIGNFQDYGARMYDTRLARFISPDPIIVMQHKYQDLSPYQFASNTPIQAIDLDGLEKGVVIYNWYLNGDKTTIKIQRVEVLKANGENVQLNLRKMQNGIIIEENSQFNQNQYLVIQHVYRDNKKVYTQYFQKENLDDIEKSLDVERNKIENKYTLDFYLDNNENEIVGIKINTLEDKSEENKVIKLDKPFKYLKQSKTFTKQEFDKYYDKNKLYGCYTCEKVGNYEEMSSPPHVIKQLEDAGNPNSSNNNQNQNQRQNQNNEN